LYLNLFRAMLKAFELIVFVRCSVNRQVSILDGDFETRFAGTTSVAGRSLHP
jgi:hypothetical protein